jgi:hypothetical protein
MPHLVKWHDDLCDGGLVVIGMHVQNASDADVKARAKSLGMRFTVTDGGTISGVKADGIPHCVLFDHTGKMVFEGHPKDAEGKVREAFADMLAVETGGKPSKPVTTALDGFKKGGTAAELLKKLGAVRDGGDPTPAKEAKAIIARLQSGAQTRIDTAKRDMKDEPIAAYDSAVQVVARWKGSPVGKEAAELVAKLKDDKAVAAELKARPTLEKIKATETAILAAAKDKEPGSAEFKKAFGPPLKQLEQQVANLKKAYPDAPATAEAEEIAKRLGVGK